MGLGLDRVLMLPKGIDDIRLLRADKPRVAAQMLDLARYRPVSAMPPVKRELSIAVSRVLTEEALGDRVREALEEKAGWVESVTVLWTAPAQALPARAAARLGIRPGQHNALVRVVLRALDRTLASAGCNGARDAIYAALHEGERGT